LAGSGPVIRYAPSATALYNLEKAQSNHFRTSFEDTFAPKSHPGKITKALSIIKTMTGTEDVVGLQESWALLKRKSFCQKPAVRTKRQNSFSLTIFILFIIFF